MGKGQSSLTEAANMLEDLAAENGRLRKHNRFLNAEVIALQASTVTPEFSKQSKQGNHPASPAGASDGSVLAEAAEASAAGSDGVEVGNVESGSEILAQLRSCFEEMHSLRVAAMQQNAIIKQLRRLTEFWHSTAANVDRTTTIPALRLIPAADIKPGAGSNSGAAEDLSEDATGQRRRDRALPAENETNASDVTPVSLDDIDHTPPTSDTPRDTDDSSLTPIKQPFDAEDEGGQVEAPTTSDDQQYAYHCPMCDETFPRDLVMLQAFEHHVEKHFCEGFEADCEFVTPF